MRHRSEVKGNLINIWRE